LIANYIIIFWVLLYFVENDVTENWDVLSVL